MKTETGYEWDYETVEDGDIADHHFADKLSDFSPSDVTESLVLVIDIGNETQGLQDRYWAYVREGKLPVWFRDESDNDVQIKVPERFHKELKAYLKIK